MKNILSENLLRFGVKNLSESQKRALTLKSIMETIDAHGLRQEVRKKLAEVADPKYLGYAKKIAGMLMTALGGADDEQGVLDALELIPTYGGQPVYDNLLQIVKTSPNVKKQFGYNFNLVSSMIKKGGISNPNYDSTQSAGSSNPFSKLGLGITDEEWTPKYKDILMKYNSKEQDF